MDSGNNTSEAQNEIVQPDEVVVTDSEATEATPQAEATVQEEFYVEEEADQEQANTSMTKEQSYAAFRKEKEKRQRKNEQLEAEQEARKKLERELAELKETVGKITKGKPPTLEQYDFDEDQYQNAVKEYYAAPSKNEPEQKTPVQQGNNDEADFYLYQREQELSSKFPDYEKAKSGFIEKIQTLHNEPNADKAIAILSDIARHKRVDIAKAIVAMDKSPDLINQIYSANNVILIGDLLEKAASKLKVRSKKPIDSQPEPVISNSGQISNASGTVAKLRAEWIKDSANKAKYNAYITAKNKKGE